MPPKKEAPKAVAEPVVEQKIDPGPDIETRREKITTAFQIFDPEKTGVVKAMYVIQYTYSRYFHYLFAYWRWFLSLQYNVSVVFSSFVSVPISIFLLIYRFHILYSDAPTIMRYLRLYVTDKDFTERVLPEIQGDGGK